MPVCAAFPRNIAWARRSRASLSMRRGERPRRFAVLNKTRHLEWEAWCAVPRRMWDASTAPLPLGSAQSSGVALEALSVSAVRFAPGVDLPRHEHDRPSLGMSL